MTRRLPVRISPLAASDLELLVDYIAQDKPRAAQKFLAKLRVIIVGLADTPAIGRERPELGERIRSLPVGKYVIFYRLTQREVTIARVLHGAQDLSSQRGLGKRKQSTDM